MKRVMKTVDSPVGTLTLVANEQALVSVYWAEEQPEETPGENHPILEAAARQLAEYFAGKRQHFDVPLAPDGGTEFQQRVWLALGEIPYGKTWSYGELAKRVGNAKASRAVGAANGQNPLPIFVPCHRVIGADGSLTGFGGGMERKKTLLALEATPKKTSRVSQMILI
jgi:methylated-DNA-[protein]-cysteine S-methyltransferase